jgi:hypothetical protein
MQVLRKLPDPRVYPRAADATLVSEAAAIAAMPAALQQEKLPDLAGPIAALLSRDEESAVRSALAMPGSAAAARLLHDAIERALSPPPADAGVQTRLFAIPLLMVSGGDRGAKIPGVVPDIAEVSALFEKAGALGHARNFGFSNALTSLDALEAVSWSRLYAIAHGAPGAGVGEFDLPPADIVRESRDETVDLRFLAGAMVIPADAPGFVETGADIGRWGMGLTRALAASRCCRSRGRRRLSFAPRAQAASPPANWACSCFSAMPCARRAPAPATPTSLSRRFPIRRSACT